MYKNSVSRKDNATFLAVLPFALIIFAPIWGVILLGLLTPILIAMFIAWAIFGVTYMSIKQWIMSRF
jgi:hypothetical protein